MKLMAYTQEEFNEQISDLYQHLYDLVYLRTHPLTDVLVDAPDIRRKDKAWLLHELLLDVIEELDPGPEAPAFSREWRRHRLMVGRYKNGMEPAEVWQEIAVSRRQYYREHRAALNAIAKILWQRYMIEPDELEESAPVSPPVEDAPPTHEELLRREVARAAYVDDYTRIDEVIEGVVTLLASRMAEQQLTLERAYPETLPDVAVERGLLRQLLLGLLGYLVDRVEQTTVQVRLHHDEATLRLTLRVDPAAIAPTDQEEAVQERLAACEELAALSRAHIVPHYAEKMVAGFDILLPTDPLRPILVVDDNEDVLELLRRFLTTHRYRVITARSAGAALDLAIGLQPDVITLDLMMPEQDGWDLLQTLRNRPETQHIPIVVCSVLKQKDLALSLGATTFLKKPVTEQALLRTLHALKAAPPSK
jgi:CheY-like chemotaxis protein